MSTLRKLHQKLHEEYEEHRKHLSEAPEDRHFDILWQRRMETAQVAAEEHLPTNSPELKRIREHLHECRKLMTKALESKS